MKCLIKVLSFFLVLNIFFPFSFAVNSENLTKKRPLLEDELSKQSSNKLKSFSCLFYTCKQGPFKSIDDRIEHVRKHEKDTFICTYPECNYKTTFSTNQTWLKHGLVKHKWCPYCPELRLTENIYELAQHISNVHTPKNSAQKKTFICDKCEDFIGFSQSDLNTHQKGKFCSSNKKIYKCSFSTCSERFLDEKNTMNHVGTVHRACYWCQKGSSSDKQNVVSFSTVKELAQHIVDMGHTVGLKNIAINCYICEDCNYFTIWSDFAKRHLLDINHLKKSKINTVKDMIKKSKIGRKESLATSLVCHFCKQSFANNKKETVFPLKNHILSKHHYCPFKGKKEYFGSCEFNLNNFSLEELSVHMSSEHKHSRQAEVKSVWCEDCNFIAFTTNKPHQCRIKSKKSLINSGSDDDFEILLEQAKKLLDEKKIKEENDLFEGLELLEEELFSIKEKSNINADLLLLNSTKKCCEYNTEIQNIVDNDYSCLLYNEQQLLEKKIINFKNHLVYKHNACVDCFKNGIFDSLENLFFHINTVHNLEEPEKFVFGNNSKFYCPICIENSLQTSQEDLVNHLRNHY